MTAVNQVGNALTGLTGTGAFVGANTPTLITPNIGAATGTSLTTSGDITSTAGKLASTVSSSPNLLLTRDGGSAPTQGSGTIFFSNLGSTGSSNADAIITSAYAMGFQVNTSGSPSIPLVITVGGSVGIGTVTPSSVLQVAGQVTASSFNPSSTSGVIGTTTNDSAAAGSVGEEIESVVTLGSGGVSLTNATSANVTSISLTAGDWDVWGNVGFSGDGTTTVVYTYGWISSTSATTPDAAYQTQWAQAVGTAIFAAGNLGFPVPGRRFSLSGTTTIYLSVNSQFAVSTEFAYGGLYARRRR